jgi:hypothetical protein
MAIIMKGSGVDIGATLEAFDKRIQALEGGNQVNKPSVTSRVDEMLKTAQSHLPAKEWTPAAPKKA